MGLSPKCRAQHFCSQSIFRVLSSDIVFLYAIMSHIFDLNVESKRYDIISRFTAIITVTMIIIGWPHSPFF